MQYIQPKTGDRKKMSKSIFQLINDRYSLDENWASSNPFVRIYEHPFQWTLWASLDGEGNNRGLYQHFQTWTIIIELVQDKPQQCCKT